MLVAAPFLSADRQDRHDLLSPRSKGRKAKEKHISEKLLKSVCRNIGTEILAGRFRDIFFSGKFDQINGGDLKRSCGDPTLVRYFVCGS